MPDISELTRPGLPGIGLGTKVAVTGATGFLGGRLVEQLAEAGADVTCLIRGATAGTRLHRAGARMRRVELSDQSALRDALRGISHVFHLAYDWGDTEWNLAAMRALIDACLFQDCERLVHVSSFVVYDIPQDGDVSEATPPSPATSGYSHTKLELEALVLAAVRERALPATIIQPTIVYGPHSRPWTSDPADMLRFGTVVLPAGDAGLCNAVYVDDVVDAMLLAAVRPQAIGQRYLISGPEPVTWDKFYGTVARAIGAVGPQHRTVDEIARYHGRLGKLKQLARNPDLLVHRVLRIGPARKLARLSMRVLPHGLRQAVQDRWLVPERQRPGHVHWPNPGHLRFLQGRSVVRTGKARDELGFVPAIGFDDGMEPTARFLNEVPFREDACR